MTPRIIAIAGHKRSGKSTVAAHLRDRYGFQVIALADPIKAACREIFGWTTEHTDGALKETIDERYGLSPRQAMQHLGTEWGQFGLSGAFPRFAERTERGLWVRRLLAGISGDVVVPDVRFLHEAGALGERGAVIWRICRPDCRGDAHASEAEVDRIAADAEIENCGTLADLLARVDELMLKGNP